MSVRRSATHTRFCVATNCGAFVELTIRGEHDLSSAGQVLGDVAIKAGWDVEGSLCPVHRLRGVRT